MKNRFTYILFVLTSLMFVASCNKLEESLGRDDISGGNIEPQCLIESNRGRSYSSDDFLTKALINQTSNTDTILCNFLRLDQIVQNNETKWDEWENAYMSEGTISTVATGNDHLRSISLHPAQPYNSNNSPSRMIGWYPRTDRVPQTVHGTDVTIQYKNFTNTYVEKDGKACVKFTGLDGSIDLMVSDMKEGSQSEPFNKSKYFQFKHYLSAVRIYASSENSPQDIGLWKEIQEVVIRKQPTSCIVELPSKPDSWGNVVEWGNENAKFKIQKNHIFGENDTDYLGNMVAEQYPVQLGGSDSEKYLGYSLIQPNHDLTIQVHTEAGVYNVEIPASYTISSGTDSGEGTSTTTASRFNAGCIYDIHLNFKTDGTIFAYIETDGNEKYFDLSSGQVFNAEGQNVYGYKNANCYIINSNPGASGLYDGYCFDATVVGNGEGGIISTGAQTFYPQNAHIEPYSAEVLWQTSPRLISQVELLYGYVRFKVAKETTNTYKEGNAVIAVYDNKGNVLWSWHIWITDTPQDLTYTEGNTSITIMDRNLGAIIGETPGSAEEALASYGLYYQWGRKDPSMGPPTYNYSPINMTTAPYYDYSSDRKDAAEVVRFAMPTLRDAVENPMYLVMPTMLTQTYSFNWLYEKIDFLWGYSKTTGYTHKTIYDPCPYGYRVSGGELSDLFTYASGSLGEIVNRDYGQEVKVPKESTNPSDKVSIFFPYSGYKGVDRGLNSLISSWKYVGQKGDYQSSIVSAYTGDSEYYMHRSRIYLSKDRTWNELNVGDYTGHQIQDHTNRRTAAPVRCVKNEDHKRLMAFITPDKYTISSQTSTVHFTLYAYAIESTVTSATLSIGYHLESDPDTHKEHVIKSWSSIDSAIWQPEDGYTCNFNDIKDDKGNPLNIDVDSTKGEFRFILTVKSQDNIYKQSSTTIRLEKNYVEFLNWENTETFFAGSYINKRFRIYGDSEPERVEIWQKGAEGNDDTQISDVTIESQSNTGSEYSFDSNYSISGLKFDNEGTYTVYLKIILENGQTIITGNKVFVIEQPQWTEATSMDHIISGNMYLIMNVSTEDYAYDGGDKPMAKATYNNDHLCHFIFEKVENENSYYIKNDNTGHYANVSRNTLYMNAPATSATKFVIEYNATGNYFRISTKIGTRDYYWRQSNTSSTIDMGTGTGQNNTTALRWKIYKRSSNSN